MFIYLEDAMNHKDLGNVPFLILLNKTVKPQNLYKIYIILKDKKDQENIKEFDEKFALILKELQNREYKTEKVSAFQPFLKNSFKIKKNCKNQ